ncbi:MAG TPA: response regulator transcription factor [Anaerolineae bacterium]|nr:response regulator transcription factor [Anaerolineae bacterium]
MSGITLFLAEDSTILRDAMRYMLEAQPDLRVVGDAADGREAVRQVAQLCPEIVIMDIGLPGLNGIEATRQIRDLCPAIHVIILSIHCDAEYVTRALKAGAEGYLLKDSAGAELITAIRVVSAGHHYLSPAIADQVMTDYKRQLALARPSSPLDCLSPREQEILQLVAEGKSNNEIGALLYLSPKSVHTYRKRLMEKLDIHDLSGLIKFAIQQGLIPLT